MTRCHPCAVAAAVCFAIGCAACSAGVASVAPPVPFYATNVLSTVRIGAGSVVITTRDSAGAVCAWYRKHLRDQNGASLTGEGAHIFYTHSGATVDVEPANRFAPDTTIGLSWDARKFGDYRPDERPVATP